MITFRAFGVHCFNVEDNGHHIAQISRYEGVHKVVFLLRNDEWQMISLATLTAICDKLKELNDG